MTIDLKDRLYTSSEVAEILGVSLRSVYRYLEEGKLDADIKTATGRHRFSKKNILDFLKPSEPRVTENSQSPSQNVSLDDEDYDLEDLLDLPAISKVSQDSSKNENDDFEVDFDEEFFKNLEKLNVSDESKNSLDNLNFDSGTSDNNPYSKVKDGEFQDDELEKLLREFEEKELDAEISNPVSEIKLPNNESSQSSTQNNNLVEEEDELSKLLKNLEMSLESESMESSKDTDKAKSYLDELDFDFDLDLESSKESKNNSEFKNQSETESTNSEKEEKNHTSVIEEEEEEDNWLERFRKAAEKNSVKKEETKVEETKDLSNMFSDNNLDVFFNNLSKSNDNSSNVSSIALNEKVVEEAEEDFDGRYEYLYTSSLGGLKEIAQNVDGIAKKFDIDYAFTLNAGLSLHKPIAPFSLIHLYVREKDLELFEDYLQLNPSEDEATASVCLITQDSNEVFRDVYELHGLRVVSNVQLRSDLIDKGLDKLAREI